MAQDDSGLDEDLGEATIVYEDPDGDAVEESVPNEHVAYFQDHWILKLDTDERGRDMVRRIPAQRVYYVERSVEEFEEEVKTIKDRVEDVAEDLRTLIPGGGRGGSPLGGGDGGRRGEDEDVTHIDVDSGKPVSYRGPDDEEDEDRDADDSDETDR